MKTPVDSVEVYVHGGSSITFGIKNMKPQFINIDLELITKDEPTNLINDLGDKVSIMYSGPIENGHLFTCEISDYLDDELSILQEYIRIFTHLSTEGNNEWNQAIKREFNFGYETETTPERVEISFSEDVLSLLKTLDGSFGITVYNNQN